jgi:hypothetical protein
LKVEDLPKEELDKFQDYSRMVFSKLQQSTVQDVLGGKAENFMAKNYNVSQVNTMLKSPTSESNQRQLRQMSLYLYLVSSHYRRLINYFAELPTFNYIVKPVKRPIKDLNKSETKKYKTSYYETVDDCERYSFKTELPKIMIDALLEGAFFGLIYETEDSFYIKPFPADYAKISSVEDGCYRFSIDLNYFNNQDYLFSAYGEDIQKAYYLYAGNKETGQKGDKTLRWYEPENGFCIKCDENPTVFIPYFAGLFKEVLDLEDYRLLAKAKTEIDNYKVLVMEQDTDDNGMPKMNYELALKYYREAAGNLPDGIGLILSPFKMLDFTFDKANVADTDNVNKAEGSLWSSSGTTPLLFGSTKATSSSSLILSTKPDEQIAFTLLDQIERNFNLIQKKKNKPYGFMVSFLHQSIFNEKDVRESYSKAAQYGVTGAKLMYAASIGISPSDIVNFSYLEDDVLGLTTESFNRPMISSNTQSSVAPADSDSVGRPTNESQGKQLSDSGEANVNADQQAPIEG